MSAWKPGTYLAWGAIVAWTLACLWYNVFTPTTIHQATLFVASGGTIVILTVALALAVRKTFRRTSVRFVAGFHWPYGVLSLVALGLLVAVTYRVSDMLLAGWRDGLPYLIFVIWGAYAFDHWTMHHFNREPSETDTPKRTVEYRSEL